MFRRPFSFEGRIRRTEYGLTVLIYYAFVFILEIADTALNSDGIVYLALIPALWFMLAQGTKRCHDRSHHGGWQLIPFYMLWMLFADGDPHTNKYGEDPKGRGILLEQLLQEEPVEQ
jgi:uncharacterized membrane protein YhaH (DUF805 family)